MSILIKDADMPKSCVKCLLMRENECKVVPRLFEEDVASKLYHGRLDNCPLVEVVMCKDCRYFSYLNFPSGKHGNCDKIRMLKVSDNDFCSYGERRENEQVH